MQKFLCFSLLFLTLYFNSSAQVPSQTIRGTVVDEISKIPIPGATVIISSLDPVQGAATDIMTLVDRYAQSLQISRANEGALDGAMQEVDDWNKRFASNKNETPSKPEV